MSWKATKTEETQREIEKERERERDAARIVREREKESDQEREREKEKEKEKEKAREAANPPRCVLRGFNKSDSPSWSIMGQWYLRKPPFQRVRLWMDRIMLAADTSFNAQMDQKIDLAKPLNYPPCRSKHAPPTFRWGPPQFLVAFTQLQTIPCVSKAFLKGSAGNSPTLKA